MKSRLFSALFSQSAVHYSFSLSPPQLNLKSDPIKFKDTRQAAYHVSEVEQKQLNLKSNPPPEAGNFTS